MGAMSCADPSVGNALVALFIRAIDMRSMSDGVAYTQ